MNDTQFINHISNNFNCSKLAARAIVNIFTESVYLAIAEGNNVDIKSFGKFKVSNSKERKIFSYKNGKSKAYKKQHRLLFSPASDLKLAMR